ncbi:hypothetical protein JQK62_19350, partial [Leptospira santarosai]|nr:hypothetical protein [Leptospira santarosai]
MADEDVAKDIPEIDIILSAHDHQLYSEAKIAHGTIMNSAGNYGEYLGVVDIEINKNKQVELIYSATLPTKNEEIDERITAIMKENKTKAITALSRPLYDLKEPLWHDVLEENPLTNLIADGLKDMLGCEI